MILKNHIFDIILKVYFVKKIIFRNKLKYEKYFLDRKYLL